MSHLLTGVSLLFFVWAWAISWNYIPVRPSGDAGEMGTGLLIAFLGLIGIGVGLVAFVWALITQPAPSGKLVPLVPFVALGLMFVQYKLWRMANHREFLKSQQGPHPWLVIDADRQRRAALVADVKALDARHVVTELDSVTEISALDQTLIESITVIVMTWADVDPMDPERGENPHTAGLRRVSFLVPVILIAPDEATGHAGAQKLSQLGVSSPYIVVATDVASLKGPWAMTLPRFKPQY